MKFNYKNICLAALAACSVTACDLDTAPTTSLEADAVFKNLENADRIVRGTWNYLFNSGSTYASVGYGAIMMNDDFAGSDVIRTTSYGYSSSYNLVNGYGRGEINDVMWDLVYDPINNCNAIIKISMVSQEIRKKRTVSRDKLMLPVVSCTCYWQAIILLLSIKIRMLFVYLSIQNQPTTIWRQPESRLQVYRKYTNRH